MPPPPKYAHGPHIHNQQYCLYAIKPLNSCSSIETLKNLPTTSVNLDILVICDLKKFQYNFIYCRVIENGRLIGL